MNASKGTGEQDGVATATPAAGGVEGVVRHPGGDGVLLVASPRNGAVQACDAAFAVQVASTMGA